MSPTDKVFYGLAAATIEQCARVCERRTEQRLQVHGIGIAPNKYYSGSMTDHYNQLDQEDDECAADIRLLLLPPEEQK